VKRTRKLSKVHLGRLRAVVTALRDAQRSQSLCRTFTMAQYGYFSEMECGSPACALGHYVSRRDLQRKFLLNCDGHPIWRVGYRDVSVFAFERHFGLTPEEHEELFGPEGCNEAKTPKEAADYIANFIKRRS